MSEGLVRALVVLSVVALALGVAMVARIVGRRRVARAPLDLTGLPDQILFFTDSACDRCDVVRERLRALGVEFREISFGDRPDTHRRVGVTGVPLLVIRDETGEERARLAGVVSRRRLAATVRPTVDRRR